MKCKIHTMFLISQLQIQFLPNRPSLSRSSRTDIFPLRTAVNHRNNHHCPFKVERSPQQNPLGNRLVDEALSILCRHSLLPASIQSQLVLHEDKTKLFIITISYLTSLCHLLYSSAKLQYTPLNIARFAHGELEDTDDHHSRHILRQYI